MTSPKKSKDIWLAQFRPARANDLPFEILRTETMLPFFLKNQPTQHTFYIIHWLEQGAGSYFVDFLAHAIQPNGLYFLTPGQVHAWQVESPVQGYSLFFTEEFLAVGSSEPTSLHQFDFFHHLDQRPVVRVGEKKIKRIADLVETLFAEYQGSQTGRTTALQALLYLLLVEAQREYTSVHEQQPTSVPSATTSLVQDFRYLVGEHFLTLRTVEDYAKELHVNAHYLSDLVKQVTGLPPGAHLRQRLALEAKRLLAHTDLTAQQIAYQLGFEDPAYFGRFFKREVGSSPNAFRQHVREKYQNS